MNQLDELRRLAQGNMGADQNPFPMTTGGPESAVGLLKEAVDLLKQINDKLPQKATYGE